MAILTTNASPAMAPWGGRQKVLGTNPWSLAAPYADDKVLALDIANTAVARGKIYLARQRGEAVPDTWALDADGVPTTDAAEAVRGLILPMAGHKGYAITFMMDVLSGALTGSQVGTGVHGPYEADKRSGCGHLMIAIDVATLRSPDDFAASVAALVDEVKAAPLAPGFTEIVYPGELEDPPSRPTWRPAGSCCPADPHRPGHPGRRDRGPPDDLRWFPVSAGERRARSRAAARGAGNRRSRRGGAGRHASRPPRW